MKKTSINYNGDIYIIKSKYDYDLYEVKLNKDKEIERLNNIINELEKELEYRISYGEDEETETYRLMTLEDKIILEKLQELKGDGSNDSKRYV